jgi:transcriptional regulator of met regulon
MWSDSEDTRKGKDHSISDVQEIAVILPIGLARVVSSSQVRRNVEEIRELTRMALAVRLLQKVVLLR